MDSFKIFLKNAFSGKRGKLIILLTLAAVLLGAVFGSGQCEATAPKEDGLAAYKAELEEELAGFCSSVRGAGRCKVMVSFAAGEQLEYKGGNLISSVPPRILGVTVLCKGGDSDSVRSEISDMLSALFDIGKNRICVLKLS